MGRIVTLVLCDAAGALLGALPALPVPEPWWQEAADIWPPRAIASRSSCTA